VFYNTKEGKIQAVRLDEIKNALGINWIFHDKKEVDIAIIPFPVDEQSDESKFILTPLFVPTDQFYEVFDIFFLSYQPGLTVQRRISPIFRSGTISIMNDDNTFYIDAAAFPGNSGSPVFLKPYNEGTSAKGGFIGIIGEYIPYREKAVSLQTGRVRVIFEENTGLSKVWSGSYLKQIIESEKFRQQIESYSEEHKIGSPIKEESG
jgi:hypothetical protein